MMEDDNNYGWIDVIMFYWHWKLFNIYIVVLSVTADVISVYKRIIIAVRVFQLSIEGSVPKIITLGGRVCEL